MENQNDNNTIDIEAQVATVTPLVKYDITRAQIAELRTKFSGLTFETTPKYEEGRKAIATLRELRVKVEAKRVQLKAGALAYGKKVDTVAKELTAELEAIEEPLKLLKSAVDDEKERIKREAAEAEKRALEEKIRLEREAEEARITAEREAKEAAARAEREAEEARLAQQRAQLEAQAAELAEQKRQQEEAARLEGLRIAAERQRLADEQAAAQKKLEEAKAAEDARQAAAKAAEEARAAAAKAEQEARDAEAQRARDAAAAAERARLDAQRAELERQQRELAEAKAKVERDEAARQAKIKAEREAAEQAERDRIAAEEARVAEAERQAELARRLEALKPDAEKLKAFAADIGTLTPPDVTSDEARKTLADVLSILQGAIGALEGFGIEEAGFGRGVKTMSEVTKRTVSTDALETLGTIIDDKQKRDAIHLAVLPVMAGARLKPGQEIAITDGIALPQAGGMLIVDPFLSAPAMPGERFWAVLKPRLVTSLRHVWTHPLLPSEEIAAPAESNFDLEKAKARAVIESIAERCNVDSADDLIYGAERYIKRGDYLCEGGRWEGVSLPDEFWPAYEVLTGEKVADGDRGSFFSCSC